MQHGVVRPHWMEAPCGLKQMHKHTPRSTDKDIIDINYSVVAQRPSANFSETHNSFPASPSVAVHNISITTHQKDIPDMMRQQKYCQVFMKGMSVIPLMQAHRYKDGQKHDVLLHMLSGERRQMSVKGQPTYCNLVGMYPPSQRYHTTYLYCPLPGQPQVNR